MKTFVTFGEDHIHKIGGEVYDKDCIAVVDGGQTEVFKLFELQFCRAVPEEQWDDEIMKRYYPRGYIAVEPEDPESEASNG